MEHEIRALDRRLEVLLNSVAPTPTENEQIEAEHIANLKVLIQRLNARKTRDLEAGVADLPSPNTFDNLLALIECCGAWRRALLVEGNNALLVKRRVAAGLERWMECMAGVRDDVQKLGWKFREGRIALKLMQIYSNNPVLFDG
jgi:hypothetical protein